MDTWNLLISKRMRPKRLSFNKLIMVGAEGFEPPTLCSQSRCATRLRYAPAPIRLYRESESALWPAVFSFRRRRTFRFHAGFLYLMGGSQAQRGPLPCDEDAVTTRHAFKSGRARRGSKEGRLRALRTPLRARE